MKSCTHSTPFTWLCAVALLCTACTGKHRSDESYLRSPECDETSGIAPSSVHPDVYYIHNDSGDINRFFAINEKGELLSTCFYSNPNGRDYFSAIDCEDIETGPGPIPGQRYVYLADIGDNQGRRPYVVIYRVKEPASLKPFDHLDAEPIRLTYPDGPKDAETLMIDAPGRQLYIVSKREDSVAVYSAPVDIRTGRGVFTLRKSTKLYFKDLGMHKWITSGDISDDGSQVVLRSYTTVYTWKRNNGEPLIDCISRKPLIIKGPQEPDGEAICFSYDGTRLISTSEGKYVYLNSMKMPGSR